MKVLKEWFGTLNQPGFTMQVNQTAPYDYKLIVGSTAQTTTVEGSAVQVQASTAELGTVINESSVNDDLPLDGRNFTQLLTLTPGASPVSVGQTSGGGGGFAGNAIGTFSFPALNGQRNRSNMFLLDGINDLGSFIGDYNFEPIVDTVQDFKVQCQNNAEFGQASGGIVNVVTKSGSNTFHGSLWEFIRNSDLDARGFFIPIVNPLKQNQYGLSGGGPVWIPKVYNGRNKTFFYGGWEGYRQNQASQSQLLTPTAVELSGNFSAVSSQLYNPFSTTETSPGSGIYQRTPFAGNQIPANLLNPAAVLYAKTLFPAAGPTLSTGNNAYDLTPAITDQDSYNGRIDVSTEIFTLGDKLKAWLANLWLAPLISQWRPNKREVWLHLTLVKTRKDQAKILLRRLFPLSLPSGPQSIISPTILIQHIRSLGSRFVRHLFTLAPTILDGLRLALLGRL
jgi:hypothetical protein